MGKWLALDLETIAHPDAPAWVEDKRPPANYRDPAKIEAWLAEKRLEELERAALTPDLCRIVCAAFQTPQWNNGAVIAPILRDEDEERKWLQVVADQIDRALVVVTFNGLGFDLPVFIRRCQYLEVAPPLLTLEKYRKGKVLDVLNELSFKGTQPYRSLKWYAKRFGLPISDAVGGKDVAALWADGEYDLIAAHCAADVRTTVTLAQRLGWLAAGEPAGVLDDASIPF